MLHLYTKLTTINQRHWHDNGQGKHAFGLLQHAPGLAAGPALPAARISLAHKHDVVDGKGQKSVIALPTTVWLKTMVANFLDQSDVSRHPGDATLSRAVLGAQPELSVFGNYVNAHWRVE